MTKEKWIMSTTSQHKIFSSKPATRSYDLVVVGGGIVGLATAREFLRRQPGLRLLLVEKEPKLASHQSGHNSGVIHSGIYYAPGSLKAKACVAGHREMIEFCQENGITYDLCGKVIVALDHNELPRLEELYKRGQDNGVQGLELIGPERLHELEPYAAGLKAIYSPNTGIVDYVQVALAYARQIEEQGGEIVTNCQVISLASRQSQNSLKLRSGGQGETEIEIEARFVITCAGLESDRISQMNQSQSKTKANKDVQIVPFRGDYYVLRPEKRHMTRGMIYPVPDPRFPFLGVHYTRRIDGAVWVGPNAVLAFGREGYGRWDIVPKDLWEAVSYPGFWKLAAKYWKMGAAEMYRDYIKAAYVKDARRYMPELQADDLLPGPSGVRAQALGADGKLVDDFLIKQGQNVIHVQNAPSPAATSSLVIARTIVDTAQRNFDMAGLPKISGS